MHVIFRIVYCCSSIFVFTCMCHTFRPRYDSSLGDKTFILTLLKAMVINIYVGIEYVKRHHFMCSAINHQFSLHAIAILYHNLLIWNFNPLYCSGFTKEEDELNSFEIPVNTMRPTRLNVKQTYIYICRYNSRDICIKIHHTLWMSTVYWQKKIKDTH